MGELERQAPGGPPKQITQAEYQRILDTRAVVGRPAAKRKRLKPCWALAVLAVLAAGALAGYNTLIGSWEAQPDLAAIADECSDRVDRFNAAVDLQNERRHFAAIWGELNTASGQSRYRQWLRAALEAEAAQTGLEPDCSWFWRPESKEKIRQNFEHNRRLMDSERTLCRAVTSGAEWC